MRKRGDVINAHFVWNVPTSVICLFSGPNSVHDTLSNGAGEEMCQSEARSSVHARISGHVMSRRARQKASWRSNAIHRKRIITLFLWN